MPSKARVWSRYIVDGAIDGTSCVDEAMLILDKVDGVSPQRSSFPAQISAERRNLLRSSLRMDISLLLVVGDWRLSGTWITGENPARLDCMAWRYYLNNAAVTSGATMAGFSGPVEAGKKIIRS